MAYIEFKPVLKTGKTEGKLDSLSEMIDAKVFVSLESMQVNFNVTINAKQMNRLRSTKSMRKEWYKR